MKSVNVISLPASWILHSVKQPFISYRNILLSIQPIYFPRPFLKLEFFKPFLYCPEPLHSIYFVLLNVEPDTTYMWLQFSYHCFSLLPIHWKCVKVHIGRVFPSFVLGCCYPCLGHYVEITIPNFNEIQFI